MITRSTVGKLMIEDALPEEMRGRNITFDKKNMSTLLKELADKHPDKYIDVTKKLSDIGRQVATETGGYSIGLSHLKQMAGTKKTISEIRQKLTGFLADSNLNDKQRNESIIRSVGGYQQSLMDDVYKESLAAKNPIAMQIMSGSRGNKMNLSSLLGSDLLYEDHRGDIIPVPVLKSYSQGLTPAEYWAGTYGARKSIISTKFATADAGFFGKQLNQVTHRLSVVDQDDPRQDLAVRGLPVDTDDMDNEGALLAHDFGGYKRNTVLTPKILKDLKARNFDRILVRSPMTGGSPDGGVYARDVGVRERGTLPGRGEMVGMTAAQAIAEPISQGQLCLAEGTLVRMADWSVKAIEDIQPGEQVIGADKTGVLFPVSVVRRYYNGVRECVRTTFSAAKTKERVTLVSTIDHKLLANARRWHPETELVDAGIWPVGEKCVRLCAVMPRAVHHDGGTIHEPAALLLGLLLGDGCYTESVHGVHLSCFDPTLVADIAPLLTTLQLKATLLAGQKGYYRLSQLKDTIRQCVITGKTLAGDRNPIVIKLKELGLYGKYAHEKTLPAGVWTWDKDSVLNLIAGLLATDGSVYTCVARNVQNAYYVGYCSTSLTLINELRELLRVRFAVYAGPIHSQSKSRKRALYSFTITRQQEVSKLRTLLADRIPGRKRTTLNGVNTFTSSVDTNFFYRQEQETLGDLPTYDIEVNHPDHLFVLANGLIVSNSAKHSGGVAGQEKTVGGFQYINQLIQVPKTFKGGAAHTTVDGRVQKIEDAPAGGKYVFINDKPQYVGSGFDLKVKPGDDVEAGDIISDGMPNPSIITEHKGIGEGRKYFVKAFRDSMGSMGLRSHRRNIELIGRGLIDHVRMTEEYGDHVPDDVIPYSTLEHGYKPREGFQTLEPSRALNKYLEKPVLHYSIGTKVRPGMLKDMQYFGIKDITVHDKPAPFQPEMVRAMYNLHHDPDWMTRMYGSGLKSSLLDATHRGSTSSATGTSFVPGLAKSVDFGRVGQIRQSEPGLKPDLNTPVATPMTPNTDTEKLSSDALYHGSSSKLNSIEPRPNRAINNEAAVFGTPNRALALSFMAPWTDADLSLGSTNNEPYVLEEQYPGAFEKIYKGKSGFLHHLPSADFAEDPRLMPTERIARKAVKPVNVEKIKNLWDALQTSGIVLKRHGDKSNNKVANDDILPQQHIKFAEVYTANGDSVQGVGLRKLYHALLDEKGISGLGVNNEETGNVELAFNGDEAQRKNVFDELATRIQAKTGKPVTFAPLAVPQQMTPVNLSNADAARLNAIHHLAYRMSNMYDPSDAAMHDDATFKQNMADRFRLAVTDKGLTGTVPSRAAEQLLGTRPMYSAMAPEYRVRDEDEAMKDMAPEHKQKLLSMLGTDRGFLNNKTNNKLASDDILPGGIGDKYNVSDFPKKEMAKGVKTESEHTTNPAIAADITKDHLVEDPKYYTKLEKVEKKSAYSIADGIANVRRKDDTLSQLLEAKKHSDAKRYDHKNAILRKLMQQSPQDWLVDDTNAAHYGVTHVPTSFRLHTDPSVIPPEVTRQKQAEEPSSDFYSIFPKLKAERAAIKNKWLSSPSPSQDWDFKAMDAVPAARARPLPVRPQAQPPVQTPPAAPPKPPVQAQPPAPRPQVQPPAPPRPQVQSPAPVQTPPPAPPRPQTQLPVPPAQTPPPAPVQASPPVQPPVQAPTPPQQENVEFDKMPTQADDLKLPTPPKTHSRETRILDPLTGLAAPTGLTMFSEYGRNVLNNFRNAAPVIPQVAAPVAEAAADTAANTVANPSVLGAARTALRNTATGIESGLTSTKNFLESPAHVALSRIGMGGANIAKNTGMTGLNFLKNVITSPIKAPLVNILTDGLVTGIQGNTIADSLNEADKWDDSTQGTLRTLDAGADAARKGNVGTAALNFGKGMGYGTLQGLYALMNPVETAQTAIASANSPGRYTPEGRMARSMSNADFAFRPRASTSGLFGGIFDSASSDTGPSNVEPRAEELLPPELQSRNPEPGEPPRTTVPYAGLPGYLGTKNVQEPLDNWGRMGLNWLYGQNRTVPEHSFGPVVRKPAFAQFEQAPKPQPTIQDAPSRAQMFKKQAPTTPAQQEQPAPYVESPQGSGLAAYSARLAHKEQQKQMAAKSIAAARAQDEAIRQRNLPTPEEQQKVLETVGQQKRYMSMSPHVKQIYARALFSRLQNASRAQNAAEFAEIDAIIKRYPPEMQKEIMLLGHANTPDIPPPTAPPRPGPSPHGRMSQAEASRIDEIERRKREAARIGYSTPRPRK